MPKFPTLATALGQPRVALPAVVLHRAGEMRYATADKRYEVAGRIAEGGYRTYDVRHVDGAHAVVALLREVRECIGAHMVSGGATWHAHLVH
ncbi:hypothetical protein [Nocardia brasiliensis]|uniref:hypothetical protein n=1 Tax=Nocardia brasiliensis TaxID=37326 RepID=UPI0024544AE0|nr:hypothetical protein [Nocardia brasiliensis]